MYICKVCDSKFVAPHEISLDAGVHFDTGIIGKAKTPSMKFCPECRSRDYEELSQESVSEVA